MDFNGHTERFAQPFSQASLADHFEYEVMLKQRERSCILETLKFLAADDSDLMTLSANFPPYDAPLVHRGLRACFPDWTLVSEGRQRGSYNELWAPRYSQFEVAPGVYRSYLDEGHLLYSLPIGKRRVIAIYTDHGREIRLVAAMIGRREDMSQMRQDHRKFTRWMRRHHYLKKRAIRPDGSLLPYNDVLSWDDVVLEDRLREVVLHNTVDFLRLRPLFRANGIPQKRGLLLHGSPGNGKTMVAKLLAGTGIATFLYVTAAGVTEPDHLPNIFRLARRLRPTILFLEDLDFYASERRSSNSRTSLGELLTQLDGLEENDGLVVVATTNDLAAIEPALKDRPSRFDVVLEIGPPSEVCRRKILQKHLRQVFCDDSLIAEAARRTDGFSGAQIREVALLAVQNSIVARHVDHDQRAMVTMDGVTAAIDRICGTRKPAIGFHQSF